MYKSTPTSQVAKQLKRSVSSVRAKAVSLGLKKTQAAKRAAAKKASTASRRKTARKATRKTARRRRRR
jgi:hypothetical protein